MPQAKPRPAVKAKTTPSDDVLVLTRAPAAEVEWRDAFLIDDTPYKIRATAPLNVQLQYFHLARTRGDSIANSYALEALLAPDAYSALMAFDGLDGDHVRQVVQIALRVIAES